ncbi:MAG: 2-phospho-L-lactate guanylyltransferase [Xanthobacteraceae bacterium]|nr:2-phospho-L-lactate guanylyltransferase [Xanthobacteraceae bacterium]MBX3533447.1 2-phospho-L-lactate guanylyltransferase [Xanthobacteraceae bacterium]MCW5676387.1 2-phospho-L-lactate guanylyltransferase [Xanthobacteraceae bacterium]
MSTWAIIPMKSLHLGKSRLAGTLAGPERSALSLNMFFNVLNAVAPVFGAQRTVIVSKDTKILRLARSLRLHALRERRQGLNEALRQASEHAKCRGATATLILFGDLPQVSTEEIHKMIRTARGRPAIIAAPDRAGTGTNALFVSPPSAIEFRFGFNSLRKHRTEALLRKRSWNIFCSAGLAFDVDRPEDVGLLGADQARSDARASQAVA